MYYNFLAGYLTLIKTIVFPRKRWKIATWSLSVRRIEAFRRFKVKN